MNNERSTKNEERTFLVLGSGLTVAVEGEQGWRAVIFASRRQPSASLDAARRWRCDRLVNVRVTTIVGGAM